MRYATPLFLAAIAAGAGCQGVDDLRDGNLDVPPGVIEAAACDPDPALDAPLDAILEARIHRGLASVDDARAIAAIRAQVARKSNSSIPLFEELTLDATTPVRVQALAALEALDSTASLAAVARAARAPGEDAAREQAYHTFSALARTRVRYLDEQGLARILAAAPSAR